MKKIISIIIFLICFLPGLGHCEQIKLKTGKVYEGTIIAKESDLIKVDLGMGLAMTLFFDEIESIDGKIVEFQRNDFPAHKQHKNDNIFKPQAAKSPEQVFHEVSDSVVVIHAFYEQGLGQGSGFVVDEQGIVATNFHVVGGAQDLAVKFHNGQQYKVTGIVDYDIKNDIAILKIDQSHLPVVSLGDSDQLNTGEGVYVVGAPLGLEYTLSTGILSAIREENNAKTLQVTAPISPGNSGGPLFNQNGQAIGMIVSTIINGQNLNFAIPINKVKRYLGKTPKLTLEEFSTRIGRAYNLFNVALNNAQQGYHDQAIGVLKEAILVFPEYIDAYTLLGEIYSKNGMFEESMQQWQKIVELDPNDINARINLGVDYYDKGWKELALEEYEQALSIQPDDPMLLSNIAALYEKSGDLNKAVELLEKAVELQPLYSNSHSNLGYGYAKLGRYDEAINELKKAIAIDPNNLNAKANLDWVYQLQSGSAGPSPYEHDHNSNTFSKKELETIEQLSGEIKDLVNRGKRAEQYGNFLTSVKWFEQALNLVNKNSEEYLPILKLMLVQYVDLVHYMNNNSRSSEVVSYCEKILSFVDFKEKEAGFNGLKYFAARKFADLDPGLQNIIVMTYGYLMEAHRSLGNKEKAQKYLTKLKSFNHFLVDKVTASFQSIPGYQ